MARRDSAIAASHNRCCNSIEACEPNGGEANAEAATSGNRCGPLLEEASRFQGILRNPGDCAATPMEYLSSGAIDGQIMRELRH